MIDSLHQILYHNGAHLIRRNRAFRSTTQTLDQENMASKYTDEQIDRYLEYVSMPPSFRRDACPSRDLDFLTELHAHQISAIPYENLSLHYSQDHKVDLDPQKLYHKLTVDGRGGYCMENSIFFNHVLRALGFHVYTAGVRIRPRVNGEPQGNYMGWYHNPIPSSRL